MLLYKGQTIKFEIVREARIDISGAIDPELGVPLLSLDDMFAEKLLANADRCMDRSVAYRDAIDIGMLISACGVIPPLSLAKATQAYGADIERKLVWSTLRLRQSAEREYARDALQMNIGDVSRAAVALDDECQRLWPQP